MISGDTVECYLCRDSFLCPVHDKEDIEAMKEADKDLDEGFTVPLSSLS